MWQITIDGPGYFASTFLLPDGVTTVGRAEENDIALTGTAVSRRHAQFEVREGQLYIEDLGSRNGSKLNGQTLKGTATLRPGDVVSLGENTLTVRERARVENLFTENLDAHAGGLNRRRVELEGRKILTRAVNESAVWKALDNLPRKISGSGSYTGPHPVLLLLSETAEQSQDAETLQQTLDEAISLIHRDLHATTSVILLKAPNGDLVPVAVGHRPGVLQATVDVVDDIVQEVMRAGKSMAFDDSPELRSTPGKSENQVLCAPVGETVTQGVVFINRPRQPEEELASHLDFLSAIGQLVQTAWNNARLEDSVRHSERLKRTLERFHAPQILEKRTAEMLEKGRASLTGMEERDICVLFADIAGFTALTQKLPPDRVVDLLNEFYERMTRTLFSFEGTVDKFVGDSVMALFGAPYSKKDDVVRAGRAAVTMRQEWDRAMNRRPQKERCKLKLGMAWGHALVGTVGSTIRLDYTAVGQPVSLAAWLCDIAEPGQILVTTEVSEKLGSQFETLGAGTRPYKDSGKKVRLFEISDEDRGRVTSV
jgi:adenylate cyclase